MFGVNSTMTDGTQAKAGPLTPLAGSMRTSFTLGAGVPGRPVPGSEDLEFVCDFGDGFFGVAEEHGGAVGIEQRVLNTGEAGVHRALEHDDRLGLVDVEDRHPVNRAGRVVAGRGVGDVV